MKFCGDKSILVFGIKFLAKQACSIIVFPKTTTTNWKPHIIHQNFRNRIIVEDRWSNGDVSESDRIVISFICNWKSIGVIIIIFLLFFGWTPMINILYLAIYLGKIRTLPIYFAAVLALVSIVFVVFWCK